MSRRRQVSNKHLASAIALIATLVLATAYLYGGVLGRSLTKHADTITVTLDQTGGLFTGSDVTYRGVKVGKVSSIALRDTGVMVKAKLNTDRKIPADSVAAVRSLSPAGEQFLDLQPRSDGPPYLGNGTLIGRTDTATPTQVATTLASVDRLIGQVDDKDVKTVLSELGKAFADPEDLANLLTESRKTLDTIDATWPETLRTLQNGKVVLQTGVDKKTEFADFAKSSRSLAAWLRGYDPKLRSTLEATPAQIEQLRLLVSDFALRLPPFLGNMLSLTDIAVAREPHLRELLKTFPTGAERLGDTLRDGRFHVNMLPLPGTVCAYGNGDAAPPKSTARQPLYTGGHCADTFPAQQRGAAHTPPVSQ